MSTAEIVYFCDLSGVSFWEHGWVDKRKFKGSIFRQKTYADVDLEDRDIATADVHHGWVITVVGDTSGCGWDMTTYFQTEEPQVHDGRWDGAMLYDDDGEEHPAEVADGPHKATWLEVGE